METSSICGMPSLTVASVLGTRFIAPMCEEMYSLVLTHNIDRKASTGNFDCLSKLHTIGHNVVEPIHQAPGIRRMSEEVNRLVQLRIRYCRGCQFS